MPERSRRPVILAVLFVTAFMALLDVTVVTVAIPAISKDLSAGLAAQQWVISAYTLFFSAALLTGGALGDRYGSKQVLLISVAGFAITSALCGFAPNAGTLVAARCLQGLAGAAMLPGTLSIITRVYQDPAARARAIGLWSGVAGLALIAGPVLGGWLVGDYGWRSIFFLNLPIALIAIVAGLRVLPAAAGGRAPLDPVGQVLAIVWTGTLAFALIQGNTNGWTDPLILASIALAGVAFVAFVVAERRAPDPMLPVRLFADRRFLAGNVVSFLLGFGLFSMFFFLSLYMQDIRGESALRTGLSFLPGSVAIVLAAPLSGIIAAKLGNWVPMALGLGIACVSLLTMHRLTITAAYSGYWWCILLMGLGIGLGLSPTTALVLSVIPRRRSGSGASIANTHRQVGILFGVAVLGAVLTAQFGSKMRAGLATAGVPAAVRDRIANSYLRNGGPTTGGGGGALSRAVAAAARTAFVAALHDVLTIGAVVLGVGCLAIIALRPGAKDRADQKPRMDSNVRIGGQASRASQI